MGACEGACQGACACRQPRVCVCVCVHAQVTRCCMFTALRGLLISCARPPPRVRAPRGCASSFPHVSSRTSIDVGLIVRVLGGDPVPLRACKCVCFSCSALPLQHPRLWAAVPGDAESPREMSECRGCAWGWGQRFQVHPSHSLQSAPSLGPAAVSPPWAAASCTWRAGSWLKPGQGR